MYFPKALEKLDSFSDSVALSGIYRVRVNKDTEQSSRYPGDELNCDSSQKVNGQCYVGATFMKLIGDKSKILEVIDGKGLSPDKYEYKVCRINEHLMGLYLVNSNVVLMLSKL